MSFDSQKWIDEKKLEIINTMFQNEFGIKDFRHSNQVINFDDLQTDAMKNKINEYRKAIAIFFKAEEIRSVLDYYYLQQDKKPVLNLLKQIIKYYGYEFDRKSEYQGNYAGKKVYKSKYAIVPINNIQPNPNPKNILSNNPTKTHINIDDDSSILSQSTQNKI